MSPRYLAFLVLAGCTTALAEMSPDVIDPGFTVYTLTALDSAQVIGMAVAVGSSDLTSGGLLSWTKNQLYWRMETPANQGSDFLTKMVTQGPNQASFCQSSGVLGTLPPAGFKMYAVHASTQTTANLLYGCNANATGTQIYLARAFNLSTPTPGPTQLGITNLYRMDYVSGSTVSVGYMQWATATPSLTWYLTNQVGVPIQTGTSAQNTMANLKPPVSNPPAAHLRFSAENTAPTLSNYYTVTDTQGLPVRR